MRNTTDRLVFVLCLLVVIALGLAGCQPAGTPTPAVAVEPTTVAAPTEVSATTAAPLEPTEAAASSAEPATEAAPVLTVLDKTFTMADLQALEQGVVTVDGTEYRGVRLRAALEAAGVTSSDVALVASDGYAANVTVADVTDDCLLAYAEGGGLDAVMPGMSKGSWVRGVVEIREGKPATSDEAAAPTRAGGEPSGPTLGGPISLVDAAGRTVELDSLPQRIVVVGRGPHMALHLLYMFPEGRERLVGAESRSATPSNFLPLVDPRFEQVPTLDANPNVEQIAALAPDLVIMKGIVVDKTAEALAEIDIPVLYLGLETVDDFFADLANVGAVLGNPERAEEIAAFYRSRLDRLAERTADIPEEDKPRVLLVEYSDRGGEVAVQVPARAWMQTVEVETAGGRPVWLDSAAPTDGWTVTNLEQIARWDPDKIFVVVWYTMDPQEVIDGLKADPQWSQLRAVKNNEIYAFPQDIFGWDQPEPRWILGMTWLATRIRPDRFQDIDMTAEVMAYFSELYGMDEAAIKRDILPSVRMDVH